MPKRQGGVESTKVLITELISLLEKDWEEDQVLTFLTTYKKDKDTVSRRTNSIEQNPLYILVMAIYKANTTNPNNFLSST